MLSSEALQPSLLMNVQLDLQQVPVSGVPVIVSSLPGFQSPAWLTSAPSVQSVTQPTPSQSVQLAARSTAAPGVQSAAWPTPAPSGCPQSLCLCCPQSLCPYCPPSVPPLSPVTEPRCHQLPSPAVTTSRASLSPVPTLLFFLPCPPFTLPGLSWTFLFCHQPLSHLSLVSTLVTLCI